jgi:hypothetical protein
LLTALLGLSYCGPLKPREPDASPYDAAEMLEYRFYSRQETTNRLSAIS